MSINLVLISDNGEFPLWQTPTSVTKEALHSKHPESVYIDYVLSISTDDISITHIRKLLDWLSKVNNPRFLSI